MSIDATAGSWEQRVQEFETRAQDELRRAIQYLNDEVVPDLRCHGLKALRSAAAELHHLADRIETGQPPRPRPPKEDAGR